MLRPAVLLLLVCLGLAALVSSQPLKSCIHEFKDPKVTYDLQDLARYDWTKDTRESQVDYDVYFSVCRDLNKRPYETLCNATSTTIGNAYQIKNESGTFTQCHMLGSYGTGSSLQWETLDPSNPEVGVRQIYTNGQDCGALGKRRFIVEFRCLDMVDEPEVSDVEENPTCNYTVVIKSYKACPTECRNAADGVCSGHGICEVDTDWNAAHCYCNDGWQGTYCSERVGSKKPTESSHATAVLLVIVIVLGCALLVLGAIMFRKVRKLNTDDSRYAQLAADPAEAAAQAEKSRALNDVREPAGGSVLATSSATAVAPGVAPVPTSSGVFSLNS